MTSSRSARLGPRVILLSLADAAGGCSWCGPVSIVQSLSEKFSAKGLTVPPATA
jgi:hypothetical protein